MKYPISKEFGFYRRFKPPIYKKLLPTMQGAMRRFERELYDSEQVTVSEETLDGGARLLIISPNQVGNQVPCLVFYHGGAFALPPYTYHYRMAVNYAHRLGCKVVFVRYRLMPQHIYPAQRDDALAALAWVNQNADALSIDRNRIGVCGDSAGGQLAAFAAYGAKESCGVDLSFQMLIYPALDPQMRSDSMRRYTDTPMWNARLNRRLWAWYLEDNQVPFVSLLDEALPREMAAAYIETAEFDCLRDEGLAYAKRLKEGGVAVTLSQTQGTMHGFEIVDCETTRAAIENRIGFMKTSWGISA